MNGCRHRTQDSRFLHHVRRLVDVQNLHLVHHLHRHRDVRLVAVAVAVAVANPHASASTPRAPFSPGFVHRPGEPDAELFGEDVIVQRGRRLRLRAAVVAAAERRVEFRLAHAHRLRRRIVRALGHGRIHQHDVLHRARPARPEFFQGANLGKIGGAVRVTHHLLLRGDGHAGGAERPRADVLRGRGGGALLLPRREKVRHGGRSTLPRSATWPPWSARRPDPRARPRPRSPPPPTSRSTPT